MPRTTPCALCGLALSGLALCTLALAAGPAWAQLAHHPFALGGNEGAVGHQNALGAWLLGQESRFALKLTGAVRGTKSGGIGAAPGLVALSFAYGVFHAAGPGHGKAVITAYMTSNEVALRRGLVIALLAALLQGLVATALVRIAPVLHPATPPRMTAPADWIEPPTYLGIALLGVVLVWRKGRALRAVLRHLAPPALFARSSYDPTSFVLAAAGSTMHFETTLAVPESRRFFSDADLGNAGSAVHAPDCTCSHMPDPTRLGAADRLNWKAATLAVVTAGARPCSGAILVLVFALAQGVFAAGVAATFAMSLGTAMTTGALAILAVGAKALALRLFGGGSARSALLGPALEFAAAAAVLLFGMARVGAGLAGAHVTA